MNNSTEEKNKGSSTIDRGPLVSAIKKGLDFLVNLQDGEGSWRGNISGVTFLLPLYVIACYITGREIPEKRRLEMIKSLRNMQNENGSMGLHGADKGSMFSSVLSYLAIRILGIKRDEMFALRMRGWILNNGSALAMPTPGKYLLALMNLHPYRGLNPVLPELLAMPSFLPGHPKKLLCITRQIYLPLSFLYGIKAQIRENDFINLLRDELYDMQYDTINFKKHRNMVSPGDRLFPLSIFFRTANLFIRIYESLHFSSLRKKSLKKIYGHIQYEDMVTRYTGLTLVNNCLNAVVHYFINPENEEVRKIFVGLEQYINESPDGTDINAFNSTAITDTCLALQAIISSPLAEEYSKNVRDARKFIIENEIIHEHPDYKLYYRHPSRGGWAFSIKGHGWPLSFSTSEALKCLDAAEDTADIPVPAEIIKAAVNFILSLQNRNGGWGLYERQRARKWVERLNSTRIFGRIMIDFSTVECTSACLQALVHIREKWPDLCTRKARQAIKNGVKFIKKTQRNDGSWEGTWAINFTCATWCGVSGLIAGGVDKKTPEIQRACGFLLERQNLDGGWGEHHSSSLKRRYIAGDSGAVSTAWALLALVSAGLAGTSSARRAAGYLMRKQEKNGDWPETGPDGMAFMTCALHYENFRRHFPLRALSEYEGATRNA